MNAVLPDEIAQSLGLILPFSESDPQVDIVLMDSVPSQLNVDTLAPSGCPFLPCQIVLRMVINGEPAHDDVAVQAATHQSRGAHDPPHSKGSAKFLIMAVALGTSSEDFLQGDHVGLKRA
jgi:hypothetical protein